jgi:hypothetical protein
MSEGPQYTSCIVSSKFQPINWLILGPLIGISIIGLLSGVGTIVALAAIVQSLRYVLDWMLNGKLICLSDTFTPLCNISDDNGNVFAIGEVADTEDVGEDKNPLEDVDNDYAINLMLMPFNPQDLGKAPGLPQGPLLQLQPGMPTKDGKPIFHVNGYTRTMVYDSVSHEYDAWTYLFGKYYKKIGVSKADDTAYFAAHKDSSKIEAPVLHCEFEGARIRDLLDVIEAFSLGGKWCKKNWFTRLLCVVLQSVFAPIILIALLAAWKAAKDGDISDAQQGGGTIGNKDRVLVKGRWVYDSAHDGYNEIHATRTVQKVYDAPDDQLAFEDYYRRWCNALSQIPSSDRPRQGQLPVGISGQALTTYNNLQLPENQWIYHPEVDGCAPDDPTILR